MNKIINLLFVIIMPMILTGCIGTVATRDCSDINGQFAGAYPFQAVALNGLVMKDNYNKGYKFLVFLGIISMPTDFIFDFVLSPIDLALWPFGFKKSWHNVNG
jgi:uncharacterized protein YceK